MQKVIVLRGAPASGKTTIAKKFRNFDQKIAWLKVDNFKDFFADDSSQALAFVNGSAIATLGYLLDKGFSVVMDGVFQDTSAINEALKVTEGKNIEAKVFELQVSLNTLLKRDKVREGVPEGLRPLMGNETISKIYNTLQNNQYPDAIELDTENNSIDRCVEIIEDSFNGRRSSN